MELSNIKHGKARNLVDFVLYGVASVTFAALLAIAWQRRNRRRRTLIGTGTRLGAGVDAWENEGGAPAPHASDRPSPAPADLRS
jgi:hypothetical protein